MNTQAPARTIPLLDLRTQFASIKDEVVNAIDGVLKSQYFILGPEVEALENEIAHYCGCRYAIGVSSGTDALLASLMALGISAGDEVITTPFSFFATVGSVLRLGSRVVFADIEPDSFNIDPVAVENAITPRTKAIIPVHLFGQSAEMQPLLEIGDRYGVAVIEDAAQAIGTDYKGRRAGSMGITGCFSFFPSKNLGGCGDGGMITTNDDLLADRIRIIRNQGSNPKYYHKVLGGNFRLDAIQAAVLRVKLRYLESWTKQRRANATYYEECFDDLGLAGEKIIPPPLVRERHVYNQYVIRAGNRDALREFLQSRGVSTEVYYPQALHLQECVLDGRYRQGDFPVSEAASAEVLALPIYPELSLEDKEYVVSAIKLFYESETSSGA